MMTFFAASGSGPFTVAVLVMLGLALIELATLLTGASVNDLLDDFVVTHAGLEGSTTPEAQGVIGRFLAWLYVGHVPVLMILIVWLCVFGLSGLVLQAVLRSSLGFALPGIVAAPLVLGVTLPLVRRCVGGLARILPRDETNAVSPDTFIGRTAVLVGGNASRALPAQARLTDEFGTTHYVLVVPDDTDGVLPSGSLVLLVARLGNGRFSAIINPNQALAGDQ
ncbi:hypothetical protein A167_00181 [Alcanivorax sp. S71-1-4]|jgi:hypothetical protein|uniref:YqiJ family protein n=1 Tax=Alcanivorax sp. S71-1-4 TaxID=1177159 RepID=UPI001359BC8B|nr:YqiJ family protein [Alcanivorax sp. S71-1-4]KAF0811149.1 hypothetical protein A167_00181 [Alcanivorax sp. S71-1-4]